MVYRPAIPLWRVSAAAIYYGGFFWGPFQSMPKLRYLGQQALGIIRLILLGLGSVHAYTISIGRIITALEPDGSDPSVIWAILGVPP